MPLRPSSLPRPSLRVAAIPKSAQICTRQASTSATSTGTAIKTRRTLGTIALVSSGLLLTAYYLDSRSAIHRYVIPPLLRLSTDPETAHLLAVKALALGVAPRDVGLDDENLRSELWGVSLASPVGLAAGFDKHAEAMDGLFNLGFSWVEIGSITPKAQSGNPQPRVFHLAEDEAVINRYGFPSVGFPLALARLRSFLSRHSSSSTAQGDEGRILAINLGKNKSSAPDSITDYLAGVRTFGPLADVLVINVSSPNTPGLRGLQSRGFLSELLTAVLKERDALPAATRTNGGFAGKWERPKVVVKIAPDLNEDELVDIAEAVEVSGVDGVIVSNTTIQRPSSLLSGTLVGSPSVPTCSSTRSDQFASSSSSSLPSPTAQSSETGGLSGPPLLPLSLSTLRTLRTLLPPSIPLIGCGGISSGSDALSFAQSGASSVQLYTAMSVHGAGAARRIKDELTAALAEKAEGGSRSWMDVSREAVQKLAYSHPRRYAARIARAREEATESTLSEESAELQREAEALKALLSEAGVTDSAALKEALSDKQLEEALKSLGLEAPSDESVGLGPGLIVEGGDGPGSEEVKAVLALAALTDAVSGAEEPVLSGVEAGSEEEAPAVASSSSPVEVEESRAHSESSSAAPKTVTRLV